jgi:hypothetical protein
VLGEGVMGRKEMGRRRGGGGEEEGRGRGGGVESTPVLFRPKHKYRHVQKVCRLTDFHTAKAFFSTLSISS